MFKYAPNIEAKNTAVQVRRALMDAVEAAVENEWALVKEYCDEALVLANHIEKIEGTYGDEEEQ